MTDRDEKCTDLRGLCGQPGNRQCDLLVIPIVGGQADNVDVVVLGSLSKTSLPSETAQQGDVYDQNTRASVHCYTLVLGISYDFQIDHQCIVTE